MDVRRLFTLKAARVVRVSEFATGFTMLAAVVACSCLLPTYLLLTTAFCFSSIQSARERRDIYLPTLTQSQERERESERGSLSHFFIFFSFLHNTFHEIQFISLYLSPSSVPLPFSLKIQLTSRTCMHRDSPPNASTIVHMNRYSHLEQITRLMLMLHFKHRMHT